jgi:aryl carrier-like protein
LLVGNSLTYYNAMPNMVAEIFRDSEPRLDIQSDLLAEGGATIRAHLNAGAVQRQLRAKHYDVVVFQELGGFPECPSDFRGCVD